VPIVDAGFQPVGILTWRDLLKTFAAT
jgi:hypothetical protein